MISTRDFSTTLLQTSGDVPSPRYGHRAVLTSTILMIWGGGEKNVRDQNKQNQAVDNSLYLLNLGTPDLFHVKTRSSLIRVSCVSVSREWTQIVVDGPRPGGRYYHTMTLVGSKLFVFAGRTANERFNDIWAFDLNYCTFVPHLPEPF